MTVTSLMSLVLLVWCQPACTQLNTAGFVQQINFLSNDILGLNKFQTYLSGLTYTPTGLTNQQIIQNLKGELVTKIDAQVTAVRRLQEVVQQEFNKFSTTKVYDNCCSCCSNSDADGELIFRKQVDLDALCYSGAGTKTPDAAYPNEAVLNVMKENFDENPNIKWQHYSGEDGVTSIYPANYGCDDKFDPRFRPWYSVTASPQPTDLVIIVDKSQTMTTNFAKDERQYLEIAKEAVATVVDSLNPDDRVGVVSFSDAAQTINEGCYATQLAEATPDNKAIYRSFIDSIQGSGGTNYSAAFYQAFQLFNNTLHLPDFDNRERWKVILFLTDGRPGGEDKYMDIIRQGNDDLGNTVVIMTFGIGGDILKGNGQQILQDITNQITATGPVKPGRYHYVGDVTNLRSEMARYYDFFIDADNQQINIVEPYLDAFDLGLITTICLPVRFNGIFKGVACIDVTVADLFDDVTYFSESSASYAFIADGQARLLVHPLLARPADVYDDPVLLFVQDIEKEPQVQDIITDILNGEGGSATFTSKRILSRGDTEHDGVNVDYVQSTYLWEPLGFNNLTLCVVIAVATKNTRVTTDLTIETFPYHRLDITQPSDICRYFNGIAVTGTSTVKLAPFAFESPEGYLELNETIDTVQSFEKFFLAKSTQSEYFKSDVKTTVATSAKFDDVISRNDTAWRYCLWRYVGLKQGVLRLYPGATLSRPYDHTVRPWYRRAVAQRDLLSFSKPYVDAFGEGIVITMSKALKESSSGSGVADPVAGVMGMDFTMELFNSMITDNVESCADKSCIAIDTAGYIISHPEFIGVEEEDYSTIQNIHITQKEAAIAAMLVANDVLRKDYCINFKEFQIQSFYRVKKASFNSKAFDMVPITSTNIYLIIKKSNESLNETCICATQGGLHVPRCTTGTTGCQCPCFTRDGVQYDPCNVTFTFNNDVGEYPPCTPPSPDINITPASGDEETNTVKNLEFCYPVREVCPSLKEQRKCSATAGCKWEETKCVIRCNEGCSNPTKSTPAWVIAVSVVAAVLVLAGAGAGLGVYLRNRQQGGGGGGGGGRGRA